MKEVKEVVVVCDPSYKNLFEGSSGLIPYSLLSLCFYKSSIYALLEFSPVTKFKEWYSTASK